MTNDTLVWVGEFVLNVVHELLELARFARFCDFYQRFPGVVVGAGAG